MPRAWIPSIKFLKAYNLEGKHLAKGRVGIIGGGNSAIDAARVAYRQKGVTGVTVFYRRTRAEMPAYGEEIEAALAEGIVLQPLVAPIGVVVKGRQARWRESSSTTSWGARRFGSPAAGADSGLRARGGFGYAGGGHQRAAGGPAGWRSSRPPAGAP